MSIQFIDLAAQQRRIKPQLDEAISAVLAHGKYIMGPEVKELETALAQFVGAKHCISCANGTDALLLALMALEARGGDAVFVPSFTFAATAEVVPSVGATPVFVDCDLDSFNMDPASLERAVANAKSLGLKPKAVIPVDLFGLAADYDAIAPIAKAEGLTVIADAAQGFGATYKGRRAGAIGDITTTSFFPAKPLGCYGDGGAVFTESDEVANLANSYRVHGKGSHKYDNERVGVNSRLDTMQAAILKPKLAIYQDEIDARQMVASRYIEGLKDVIDTPVVPDDCISVWAQFTVKMRDGMDRGKVQSSLKEAGVPSVVYYPMPLHQQSAYKAFPTDPEGLSISEKMAASVLSLPMHPYLEADSQARIIDAMRGAVG